MTETTTPSPNQKRGIARTLFALLMIAALTAAWAWQYWQQHQQQATWRTQRTAIQAQINQLNNQLNQSAQHRALLTANSTLQLANYQRQYHHDAKATIALLQLALQQVNPAQYPTLQNLHNALQHDLTVMQAHAAQNPSTWLIQLDALKHTVPQLQQIPKQITPVNHTTQATTPTAHKAWQRAWQKTKQVFATMVVLRHTDHAITPMLATDDVIALQNNLALTLSQAQWAVMNHQPKLYQQSIATAIHMLSYFATNDPNTEAFANELNKLKRAPMDASLPTLDQSFAAIDRLLSIQADSTTHPTRLAPASVPTPETSKHDAASDATKHNKP